MYHQLCSAAFPVLQNTFLTRAKCFQLLRVMGCRDWQGGKKYNRAAHGTGLPRVPSLLESKCGDVLVLVQGTFRWKLVVPLSC